MFQGANERRSKTSSRSSQDKKEGAKLKGIKKELKIELKKKLEAMKGNKIGSFST